MDTLREGLTLVVPTYRRPDAVATLLSHVQQLSPAPVEVIVVAGDEASAAAARQFDVRVLRVENRSAAASRNTGWRAARSTCIGFLDDDCLPPATWVGAALEALDGTDDVRPAAVGGHVSNPRPDLLVARVAQEWLGRRFAPGPAEWLATQNLATRRAVLEDLGGFDESLAAYEDVDFSLRVRAAGGALWRVPAMQVGHEHRGDVRGLLRQHRGYGRGFVQLARKHPAWGQGRRAPLTATGRLRALALAAARPLRCALGMPRPADRVASLPLFALRELAFLRGAWAEARR